METVPAAPHMDTDPQSSFSEGACCKEESPGGAARAPPRVDSYSEMDTRPPLTPDTMMALDMDSQPATHPPLDAFHMHELITDLPTLDCQPTEPNPSSTDSPLNTRDQDYQETASPCPPCPLHISIGKGQAQMVSRSSESDLQASASRGLFLTEVDTGHMINLFQHEGGTLADGSTGTPLATLEALTKNEEHAGGAMLAWGQGETPSSSSSSSELSREDTWTSLAESEISEQRPLQENDQETLMRFPRYPAVAKGIYTYTVNESIKLEAINLLNVSGPCEPEDLLGGVIFGASYLGSTQLECERHQMASTQMKQAREAVDRVKVFIQKQQGEVLGVTIVESGWGSLLPTVVIANLMHGGPAERSGELSIGDHVICVNGTSLVGLPFSTCQGVIRELKGQSDVTLRIVHCPPVVTAIIHRPNASYQLGFCVEDGVICSLVRGGIAEKGGIRVGHRIIEINGQSVVATSHDRIIQTLLDATGEVHIKTMPASTYRLLTGQETPTYL
ncbi:amyloid-beta A4 precursor protein-binding family A member 3 isoform X5 [Lithobates pipiens]